MCRITKSFLLVFVFSICTMCFADEQPSLQSQHCTVSLLSDSKGYTPGASLHLGFLFKMDPGWHVYWKNPGDSGSSPKFNFKSQEALSPGEIEWPAPQKIAVGALVDYGYPDEVLLPFPLGVSEQAKGTQSLRVHAEWLVCKDDCIPGEGDIVLSIPENNQIVPSEWSDLFKKYRSKVPVRYALDSTTARFTPEGVIFDIPEDLSEKKISFLPDTMGIIQNVLNQNVDYRSGHTYLTVPRAFSRKEPSTIDGVLYIDEYPHQVSFSAHTESSSNDQNSGLFQYILFALIGGVLLNLMPCVFPVIGIKVLSLFEEAEMKSRSRMLYVALYELGIAASLWGLFAIVLIAKSFGTKLGWGFQLQEPQFVAFLALFFVVLGFGFLGFLEFHTAIRFVKQGIFQRLL